MMTVLYVFGLLVVLHLIAAAIIFVAAHAAEKKQLKAELSARERWIQQEDARIEAIRVKGESQYYARQRSAAATTVMPLVDPQDLKR